MMSGAILIEHCVVLFNKPPALQLLNGFTLTVVGVIRPLAGVKVAGTTSPAPFPTKLVCGDSTDTANQATLFQSCTQRMAGWRAQLKPATYCASMVSGVFSVPFRMPTRFWVAKLHIWPALKCVAQASLV